MLELYNWTFQAEGKKKQTKKTSCIFYAESKHERTNPICELCTIYNFHIIITILQ